MLALILVALVVGVLLAGLWGWEQRRRVVAASTSAPFVSEASAHRRAMDELAARRYAGDPGAAGGVRRPYATYSEAEKFVPRKRPRESEHSFEDARTDADGMAWLVLNQAIQPGVEHVAVRVDDDGGCSIETTYSDSAGAACDSSSSDSSSTCSSGDSGCGGGGDL